MSRPPARCLRTLLPFAVLAVLFLGASAEVPTTGSPVPELAVIDDAVLSFMAEWDVPGMAVGLAKDGRLVFARGYGFADVEEETPVQPDSLFRIASVSKPITAVAILRLVEEGRLSLDDHAFRILADLDPPQGATPDPRLFDITIEHLLTHTAGFGIDQLGIDPQFGLHQIAAEALGVPRPASASTLVRYMIGETLLFDPGTQYRYSNFGYNVLGRVIEEITGQEYETFVREEILMPMGILHMQIGRTRVSDRAPGEVSYYGSSSGGETSVFSDEGPVAWPDGRWYLEAMDAHGGWITSAIDMMRFATHVDGFSPPGDALAADTLESMTARPSLAIWESSSWWYGLGWSVNEHGTWWHNGSLDGTTAILVRTDTGLSWFVAANYRPWLWGPFNSALDDMMWDAIGRVSDWPSRNLFDEM